MALCATTIALLAVSLSDLAGGIHLLTGQPEWRAWLLAIGIDAMLVAVEWGAMRQGHCSASKTLVAMTAVLSAYLNSLEMTGGHLDLGHLNGIVLGTFLPTAIFLATLRLGKMK